jgi:hypothetical protein
MFRLYPFITFIFFASCGSHTMLKQIKTLPDYPSASGIEYFNNQYYIIGDDANNLLILDSSLNPAGSIPLYSFAEKRIPKPVKADLEGITLTKDNKLLLLGSGSLSPTRNAGWLIDPITNQKDSIRLDTFYQRLKLYDIEEINIEGVCSLPSSIILSNRGSKGYKKNQLIVTSKNFWTDQANATISIILAGFNPDSTSFNGISGLTYSGKSDQLILTVSTEETKNSMDDGAIGKSYLWIVNNISAKLKWKALNPDKIIDLDKLDPQFKGQKIESVCVTEETNDFLHLVLAADNDNGSSTIFKVVIKKD